MRKLYWLAVVVGIILTPLAHEVATKQRGYGATGGEILIIPFFLLIALLADQMYEMIMVLKSMQEKEKSQ